MSFHHVTDLLYRTFFHVPKKYYLFFFSIFTIKIKLRFKWTFYFFIIFFFFDSHIRTLFVIVIFYGCRAIYRRSNKSSDEKQHRLRHPENDLWLGQIDITTVDRGNNRVPGDIRSYFIYFFPLIFSARGIVCDRGTMSYHEYALTAYSFRTTLTFVCFPC